MTEIKNAAFLIFISITLITSSFPPFSIPFAGIIGLSVFFHSLSKIESAKASFNAGAFFGLLFAISAGKGILYSSIVHYGKSPVFAVLFFTASTALPSAILHGIFAIFFNILKSDRLFSRIFTTPALWVLFEYLREIIPGSIPWANMGYTMISCLPYVQIADLAGLYGISFIIAASAALAVGIYSDYANQGQKKYSLIILLLALIIVPIIYGLFRTMYLGQKFHDPESDKGISSICIQGNYSPSDRWRGLEFFGRLNTYKSMTAEALKENPRPSVIVWPESVLNMPASAGYTTFRDLSKLTGKNSILISGGIRQGDKCSFNSAYIISGDGSVSAYDKNILLPYAEKAVSSFKIGSFEGAPDEFMEGKTRSYVKSGNLDLGISICLEDLYPWYIRKSVNLGARLLINISADDWFGKTGTAEMHLDAARMRAIENRRYMIRCANSGISAIISATGKIKNKSPVFERASIQGKSFLIGEKSFYSKNGDWILMLSAFILIFSFAKIIFSRDSISAE